MGGGGSLGGLTPAGKRGGGGNGSAHQRAKKRPNPNPHPTLTLRPRRRRRGRLVARRSGGRPFAASGSHSAWPRPEPWRTNEGFSMLARPRDLRRQGACFGGAG